MGKTNELPKGEKSLVKKALEFFYEFTERHSDIFLFHDVHYMDDMIRRCKEIAKGEGLDKQEYELGLVALVLSGVGYKNAIDTEINNQTQVDRFFELNELDDQHKNDITYFINFLQSGKVPFQPVEKVIRDGKDIHLGLPDALERLSLLQMEQQKLTGKTYSDFEWLERCKQYFITHSFDTTYANLEYGDTRSKNYIELEKRIDKLRIEGNKEKRTAEKHNGNGITASYNEDLFKIAFRNYINLIALADSKAGLLIQVNSILASVVVALVLRKLENDLLLFALPTACLLIGSAVTIFYSILASKPLENWIGKQAEPDKEQFFFGSFDRLDPEFTSVPWDKYYGDMTSFFGGDKQVIFEDLIKESFEVRKVLSKKFGYLAIAYKVFFAGLVFSILGFVVVIVIDHNKSKAADHGPLSKSAQAKNTIHTKLNIIKYPLQPTTICL